MISMKFVSQQLAKLLKYKNIAVGIVVSSGSLLAGVMFWQFILQLFGGPAWIW